MASITPIFLNNITATLGSVAAAGTTSFTVGSGEGAKFAGIGTDEYISAVVIDASTSPETVIEYVNITARATDTLTVERAVQDSATYPAAAIASGKTLVAVARAQELRDSWKTGGGDYYRSGYYHEGLFSSASMNINSMFLNQMYYRPFWVPVRRAFDRIGVDVSTAATAGGVLRFGLYSGRGRPESLIVDAGTAASTATGSVEVTIAQTLGPGVYWIALAPQVATCSVRAYTASNFSVPFLANATAPLGNNSNGGGYRDNGLTFSGALPSAPTSLVNNQGHAAMLRAA